MKDVADTAKMAIGWRGAKKTLISSAALKGSRGLVIYEKDNHRNRLSLEMRSKLRRDQERISSLKNVAMLVSMFRKLD
jgi:hypothetical protein